MQLMQKVRHRGGRPAGKSDHRGIPVEPDGSSLEVTAGGLCDRHGTALFSIATVLLGDDQQAEAAVVDAICAVCSPSAFERGSADDIRRELTRRVYERCGGAVTLEAFEQCDRQRFAVMLVRAGLNYREVAELLGLSAGAVVELLSAGLRGHVRT